GKECLGVGRATVVLQWAEAEVVASGHARPVARQAEALGPDGRERGVAARAVDRILRLRRLAAQVVDVGAARRRVRVERAVRERDRRLVVDGAALPGG